MMVGSTAMPVESYREAQRYFDLFRAAIRLAYPSGGYEIGLHDSSAQCVVKGRQVFKFPFQPEAIKNHYVTFRLVGNNMESYFAQITSQSGVNSYFNAYTPPAGGSYVLAFK